MIWRDSDNETAYRQEVDAYSLWLGIVAVGIVVWNGLAGYGALKLMGVL